MKNLELNQIEQIEGGSCGFAVFMLGVAAVALFTMAAPVTFTAAVIASQASTVVGFVGSSAAVGMECG